jgi:hypothetical protein
MFIRLGARLYNKNLIASVEPLHANSMFRDQYFALMTLAAVTGSANENLFPHEVFLAEDEYHQVFAALTGIDNS